MARTRPNRRRSRRLCQVAAAGPAVSAGMHGMAVAEGLFARGLAAGMRRAAPGAGPVAGVVGHATAFGVTVAALGSAIEYVNRRAEAGGAAIDAAYTTPPKVHTVSGGPTSGIEWSSLSREGVRFVNLALTRQRDRRGHRRARGRGRRPGARLRRPRVGPDRGRARRPRDGGPRAARRVRAVGAVRRLTDGQRLRQLRRGGDAGVPDPGRLRDGRAAVLAAPLVPVAGPGGDGTRAEPGAVPRAVVAAARAPGGPPSAAGRVRGVAGRAHHAGRVPHEGAAGLHRVGMDRALFLGTPAGSKWAKQWRLDPERTDAAHGRWSRSGRTTSALAPRRPRRPAPGTCLLSHHEDPITRFEPALAVQQPAWLGPAETRPTGVPRHARWYPIDDVLPHAHRHQERDGRGAGAVRRPRARLPGRPGPDGQRRVRAAGRRRTSCCGSSARCAGREADWAERRLVAEQLQRAKEAVQRQTRNWGLAPDAVAAGPGPA